MKRPQILRTLELYRSIQDQLHTCHIGGSVGLFLHGYILPRDWINGKFDLDITLMRELDHFQLTALDMLNQNTDRKSESADMEYSFLSKDDIPIKVEMQVDAQSCSHQIVYHGYTYNVKDAKLILDWKRTYAEKYKDEKHINDLAYLEGEMELYQTIRKPIEF